MNYLSCLDELLKAIAMPALVLDEDFNVVLGSFTEAQPPPWEGESPIGKTVFDLFPAEQARVLHDACLAATESKQPKTRRITLVEAEQQMETTVKLIPFLNPANYTWGVILLRQYNSPAAARAVQETAPDAQLAGGETVWQHTAPEVEDARAALRFLLQEGERQIIRLKEETLSAMGKQFFPFIEGLKSTRLSKAQQEYVAMIESCALKIAEPFARRISDPALRLSPTEIKIAGLIRTGKTNKDMAQIMRLSKSTILTHRHHIRAKLGLLNKKQNLTMFLGALGTQLGAETKAK